MRGPGATAVRIWRRLATTLAISQGWLWLRALEFALLAAALWTTHLLSVYVWKLPDGDVTLYHTYALSFWTRRPYFHLFPVEYPPLAIIPFTLTLLPPLADVHAVYAFWMGALVVAGYIGFVRFSTRRRAIIYAVYLVVGAAATLLSRFDLAPALVTLAALWTAQRRRFGYAYVLLAVGVLLKLYPAFLVPVVMIAHWRAATARARIEGIAARVITREAPLGGSTAAPIAFVRRWRVRTWQVVRGIWAQPAAGRVARGTALCLGVLIFGFACAFALSPSGAFSGFSYASDRPLQVESTPATLLWLGTLVGIPAQPNYSFLSLNYVGVLDVVLKPLSALALVGACGLVYWRQARGRLTTGQAFVACLCAVIATNKIFSPQYLIWVLPLVSSVEGFDLLWLAVCVLTTLDYPLLYQMRHPIWTVTFTPSFMLVLALRNLLLLGITARAIIRPKRVTPGAGLTAVRLDAALRAAVSRLWVSAPVEERSATAQGHPVTRAHTGPAVENQKQEPSNDRAMHQAGKGTLDEHDDARPALLGQG